MKSTMKDLILNEPSKKEIVNFDLKMHTPSKKASKITDMQMSGKSKKSINQQNDLNSNGLPEREKKLEKELSFNTKLLQRKSNIFIK